MKHLLIPSRKITFFAILGFFASVLSLTACSSPKLQAQEIPVEPKPAPDSIVHIEIRAIGDLMCHSTQFQYAKVGTDSFDFRPCFAPVKSYLEEADFTIGNIETVFAGPQAKYTGYPMFNTPVDYLDAIKESGFDFLVTANNHSLDRHQDGAFKSLDVLDNYGFGHTGTYRSKEDRDSIRIANIKGISIAILNYTYGTNGLPVPEDKPWIINLIDTALIRQDLNAARALKPDLVMVLFHWGLEYQHEPCADQKMAFDVAVSAGADLILGGHPHVIEPVDYFKTQNGSKIDSGFVIWSLGNFLSNQNKRYTDAGVILNLELGKNITKDSVWIDEISYLPTWVYRGTNPKHKIHTIFPAGQYATTVPAYLDAIQKDKMKQAFTDTDQYINLYRKIKRVEISEIMAVDTAKTSAQ